MRTGTPNHGLGATGLAPRGIKLMTLAALFGLAPIAASTALASDTTSTAALERSAAMVEIVPLQPAVSPAAPAPEIEQAPSAPQATVLGRGSASFYATKFNGRRTASGERFDSDELTAAHRTLPFGSRVRVTCVTTGKSVIVRINDRGPFSAGRMIDVSRAAARELGLVARGHGTVEIALLDD